MDSRKGLFLGAGASYDFAMPLVWQLTGEIRSWLTPEKLDKFNQGWIKQGGGKRPETIKLVKKLLNDNSLHYEQIMGCIEVEASRVRGDKDLYQDMWGMLAWFYDLIYMLLLERQRKNAHYIKTTLAWYSRFKDYVDRDYPFWVFSLNHDLIIEILACHYEINYKTGFYRNNISFPFRNENGGITGRVPFQDYNTCDFKNVPLDYFYNVKDRGVNLFKLHGALDVFLYDNQKKYLKIDFGRCQTYRDVLNLLQDVNTKLKCKPPTKITNEIAFADDNNVMQFLRRSILSGMHKFKSRVGQNIPEELLPAFKRSLNFVKELAVVGYGFGDSHVNEIFREWLSSNSKRKMVIVNPGIKRVPDEFQIYLDQCDVKRMSFIHYLAQETSKPLTIQELSTIKLREMCRKFSGK